MGSVELETSASEGRNIKPGFTLKSALALVFASFVILPVSLYLTLASGTTLAGAAVYITVILFEEIGNLIGSKFTKQELFIIFVMAGTAGTMAPFLDYIGRAYLMTSPISQSFKDPFTGKSLPNVIPSWYAPPITSGAYDVRSFIHPDWLMPIMLANLQFGVLWIAQEVMLTMISSYIYVEIEPLKFPLADVTAQLVTTVAENPRERMHIFTLSTFFSMIYSFILYGIPTIMYGAFGMSLQIIPYPWIDFTTGYFGIEKIMPGATFGIATDTIAWVSGFLLPVNVLAYSLIGSIAVWVFGNWLALTYFSGYFPLWVQEWRRGMSMILIMQRATMRVWAFMFIGVAIGLAILTFASSYKAIVSGFRMGRSSISRQRLAGYPSFPMMILLYVAAAVASVIIFHMVVPDFPIWIAAIVSIALPILFAFASTRVRGDTGLTLSLPYAWNGVVLLSGYPKVDAWFFSPNIGAVGGTAATWTENLRVAYLTETRPLDYFKAYLLAVLLYQVFSFLYVSFFWAIAPIPSSVYPWSLVAFPISTINTNIWVSRQIVTQRIDIIFYTMIFVVLLGAGGQALTRFTSLPFSMPAIVGGTMILPPFTVAALGGGLLGKYVLQRLFGREWWEGNRAVVVAGIAAGEGIITGVLAGAVLMLKSVWILPF